MKINYKKKRNFIEINNLQLNNKFTNGLKKSPP